MAALRLGLLGGTFDPPHVGHLVAAQEAAEHFSLDRVVFLVAARPPHKLWAELSSPSSRAEMVRAAVGGNPLFEVSEAELDREGPSYTVDTLRQVRASHPQAELFFLIGTDQLAELHDWHDPKGIAELATLVALGRAGVGPDRLSPADPSSGQTLEFKSLEVTRLDISSTQIRARVGSGLSIRYLVPEPVRRIIENQRLYRSIL